MKSGITAKIGIESGLLESMVKGLSVEELLKLKEIFEKKSAEILPIRPQIVAGLEEFGSARKEEGNGAFNI